MANDSNKFVLAAIVLAAWWMLSGAPHRQSRPTPPLNAPDLQAVFAEAPDQRAAKAHAHRLAEICAAAAEMVEFDGTREKPRFHNGEQIIEMRSVVRELLAKNGSYGTLYPKLGPTVGKFFEDRIGEFDQELTPIIRDRWVGALQDAAAGFDYASKSL